MRPSLILSSLLLAATSSLGAQGYPPSQRSSVTQNVALTEISIVYGRPTARGRTLWGQLVPWDSIWHPGADSATRITFARDVLIEDRPVKAGEYSMWLIPRATGKWTFILNRKARVFHQPFPGAANDALRVDVTPEKGSHMESMAIYFSTVLRDDAVLRVHWGEWIMPVRVKAPWKEGQGNTK
jgi:hypothetical protein